ncbi:MAG: tetraacyldisaccharide 4'-kinase [Chitinophagales bacterium]|nr:tetraacyldisaccharide 4'-kinase [Chitinophagales bacterium]
MRKLLVPFSLLWSLLVSFRNFLYHKGWLRTFEFDFPVILVGNLSTGGTGKTPHVEYLIRLLKNQFKVATLSRGYKRKLKGYALATELSLVEDIGDEPKQFKQKFPDVEVAVSEDRVKGVYYILNEEPDVNVIILDDGFQHRRITAGLKIIVTTCDRLFCDDIILPAGNLREPKNAYKRADILIVSKCPPALSFAEKEKIIERLHPLPQQNTFFTTLLYGNMYPLFPEQLQKNFSTSTSCLFVSGIANNKNVIQYLKFAFSNVQVIRFPDHHYFSAGNIEQIKKAAMRNGVCITTEKDAMRLMEQKEFILETELSVFVLPIEIGFLFNEAELFNEIVLTYIEKTTPDRYPV